MSTAIQPFTAVVACPRCYLVDCHRMRAPHPAPSAAEIAAWERDHETIAMVGWDGLAVSEIHNPPRPHDESAYEVVRICRCGYEWGMA